MCNTAVNKITTKHCLSLFQLILLEAERHVVVDTVDMCFYLCTA